MKLLLVLIFDFLFSSSLYAASCCVSNTGVPNLMILPAKWQQTFMLSQSRVIGDVDQEGVSTFRRPKNKEIVSAIRMDLAYGWSFKYQTGISLRYQNRSREFSGSRDANSGWSDVGLSHSYRPIAAERFWIFQTVNIPTARSNYDSRMVNNVDAHGTGTYQTSLGVFKIFNLKEWDFILSPEIHRSFARTFREGDTKTNVRGFWGTSFMMGAGYIPWHSKARYGLSLTPRLDEGKDVIINDELTRGKRSLVWDTVFNWSYSINAQYAVGVNYLDQTLMGPAENTLLNRALSLVFQSRWE